MIERRCRLSLEFLGPVTVVPSLEELERLTAVPERRVVYRDVDWSFYEQLVDSIPETTNIHVDYDGKDLEVMGKGRKHERLRAICLGQVRRRLSPRSWRFRARALVRRRGNGRRLPAGSRPTSVITFCRKSWRRMPRRWRGAPTTSRTIPTPTWRSKSTSRRRRSIERGSMPPRGRRGLAVRRRSCRDRAADASRDV